MVLDTAASDTGPAGERPLGADGMTNAEASELGVAASTTHDAASAVAGKEGMVSEKYHCTHTPRAAREKERRPGRPPPRSRGLGIWGYPSFFAPVSLSPPSGTADSTADRVAAAAVPVGTADSRTIEAEERG